MGISFFRDGIEEYIDAPSVVSKTQEGHCVETYKIHGKERFFVTLAGSHYCAHGDSLAEAIADAVWKDDKKRPSMDVLKREIREAGRDRKITLNEFRVLTGACLAGCRSALKKAGLDGSPMSADEIKIHFPDWGSKLISILEWSDLG